MKRILIVEDEKNISKLISDTLSLGKYETECAFDGEEALEKIQKQNFNLIILDIMLPKLDGFEVMKKVKLKDIPIIFLSAKNDVSSIVKGLSEGGQDYMTKPFEPLELLARVELRINGEKQNTLYEYKDIVVNNEERLIYKNNEQIILTPKEYDLFLLLLDNIGVALSRDTILNKVWGIDKDVETRTVDYHIQQLRKKLDLKSEISTVNKIGYRIEKII